MSLLQATAPGVLGSSFQQAAQMQGRTLNNSQDKTSSERASIFARKRRRIMTMSRVVYEHKTNVKSRLWRSSTVFNKTSDADDNVQVGGYQPPHKPADHLPLQKRHIAWGWAIDGTSSLNFVDCSPTTDTNGLLSRLLSPAVDTAFGGSLFGNSARAPSPAFKKQHLHISLKERLTSSIKVRSYGAIDIG